MKATLAASLLVVISLSVALVQYNTVQQLQQQLLDSESRSAALELQLQAQTDTNARLQNTFEQQINSLQENLQSSSRQLVILSDALQETREILNASAPAGP